jgi:hypothetical protein
VIRRLVKRVGVASEAEEGLLRLPALQLPLQGTERG